MCPAKFFDKNGYMYDQHLCIDKLLPDWIYEEREACFSSEKSVEETKVFLKNLGFVENQKFSDFVERHRV